MIDGLSVVACFPVEQLSMSLEDEREQVKAVKKKNSSNIRDLQRQIQSSKKYVGP